MTNKIAIMQPYIFPYIGYMNLVQASNNFVFYDDVNYIKKGWISRNKIILMGEPYRFSIPLKKPSQNVLIKDTELSDIDRFADRFLKQLGLSYKNSLYKDTVLDYVREVLMSKNVNISELAIRSIKLFFQFIGVEKSFHRSSEMLSSTRHLSGADRLIEITKSFNSSEYVNAAGGAALYNKEFFCSRGVTLSFVKPCLTAYPQLNSKDSKFYPGLSVIDMLMNVPESEVLEQLDSYELI